MIVLVLSSLVCAMAFALIGRTGDWSPFAFVLSGWALGLATGWAMAHTRRKP